MATIEELFRPAVIKGVFSRVRTNANPVQRLFGFHIGGAKVTKTDDPFESFGYDIYDVDRNPATMSTRGAQANTLQRRKLGFATAHYARSFERIPINREELTGIRDLGSGPSIITTNGEKYFENEAKRLKDRQETGRELTVASLFNGGKYHLRQDGEQLIPTFVEQDSIITVDLRIEPSNLGIYSGNFTANNGMTMLQGAGNPIITAPWSASNTLILEQLQRVSAIFLRIYGRPLSRIYCPVPVFEAVRRADDVRLAAGAVNAPAAYTSFDVNAEDGTPTGMFTAKLAALPQYTFYVYDGGFPSADGTGYTQAFPANCATFTPEISDSDLEFREGAAMYQQFDHTPPTMQSGFYSYISTRANPPIVDLFAGCKWCLILRTPRVIATTRVM